MKKNKKSKAAKSLTSHDGFRDPVKVAVHYGFTPHPHITVQEQDRKLAASVDNKNSHDADPALKHVDIDTKEKTALLRQALENGAQGGLPYMTYTEKATKKELLCHLDIIGNSKGVAEGIIIATSMAILKEVGIKDANVSINCVGDRDSSQRFIRAVTEYYRKNIDVLPPACRQLLKKDIFSLLACNHEKCKALAEDAPRSMTFLSEQSRTHFKEVLEYLDGAGVEYNLADSLLPTKNYITQTVFTFQGDAEKKQPPIYGFGARYNGLSKHLGMKRDLGAVGATILVNESDLTSKKKHKIEKSRFFFIHVGTEARFKSMSVIEMLREAGIPVTHAVIRDKLSAQFALAEASGAPYTLLMGQKECMEHSIIVRNNLNRSQNSIKLDVLVDHLKKLK